jgi:hypothetical protein
MPQTRSVLLSGGVMAILIGLIWIGQGTGHFPYPSSSFMINDMAWTYYGIVLAVLGLVGVLAASRMSGPPS